MTAENETVLGEVVDTVEPTAPNTAPNADQQSEQDYLSEWVGEGKKYASLEEAAKALAKKAVNADTFIEVLKREKADMEAELKKAKTMEQIVAELRRQEDTQPPTERTSNTAPPIRDEVLAVLKDYEAQKLQEQADKQRVEQAKQNQTKFWEALTAKVGGDREVAKQLVKNYIGSDQSKRETINLIGATDPDALLTMITAKPETVQFLQGLGQSGGGDSKVTGADTLTWSQAQKLRKEQPELYKSRAFQQKLHLAASKNPNFFNE